MKHIPILQDRIKLFLESKLAKNYTFEVWKDIVAACRNQNQREAIGKMNFLGDYLKVVDLIPEIRAVPEEWTPSLRVDLHWKFNDYTIPIRVTLVKDEVLFAQIVDMLNVLKHFGEDFDFAHHFQQNVELLDALKAR